MRFRPLAIAAALLGAFTAPAVHADTALLLVNDRYTHAQNLRQGRPVEQLSARLQDAGFDVILVSDGDGADMREGLNRLLLADEDERILIAAVGHFARSDSASWLLGTRAHQPTLATVNGNKVYMAGGELRSDSGSALGFSAIEFISRFSVDHAIISAGAVNAVTGIMDYDLEEAQFGNAVLARGRRRVVVTDASKFGQKGLVRVCALTEVDELIVDRPPPADLADVLRQAEIRVTSDT